MAITLGSRLGSGSFSTVYQSHDKQCAYKVTELQAQLIHEYQILRLLEQEIDLAPICTLYDKTIYTLSSCTFAISLDLYDGSLSTKTLSLKELRIIIPQLAEALGHLKRHNIVHNDITPKNILVHNKTLSIALTNFKHARFVSTVNENDSFTPSFAYRSPEYALCPSHPFSVEMDLWSLGVTLCHLCSQHESLFSLSKEQTSSAYLIALHEFILNRPYPEKLLSTDKHGIYNEKPTAFIRTYTLYTFLEAHLNGQEVLLMKQFYDLCLNILHYKPRNRLTPEQLLRHPFSQRSCHSISWYQAFPKEPTGHSLKTSTDSFPFLSKLKSNTLIATHIIHNCYVQITSHQEGKKLLQQEDMMLRYMKNSPFIMNNHILYAKHADLTAIIYDHGYTNTLTEPMTIERCFQALMALYALQECGIIHHHLSPQAFFLHQTLSDAPLKLGLFSQAHFLNASLNQAYTCNAPEIMQGSAPSFASDIYSLGCVLLKLGPSSIQMLGQQMTHLNPEKRPSIKTILANPLFASFHIEPPFTPSFSARRIGAGTFSDVFLCRTHLPHVIKRAKQDINPKRQTAFIQSLLCEYRALRILGNSPYLCALKTPHFYSKLESHRLGLRLSAYNSSLSGSFSRSLHCIQSMTKQIAQALCHLKEHHIVHADIKPENLLLDFDQRTVVIADFGSARFSQQAYYPAYTSEQTMEYRAPEMACVHTCHEAPYALSFAIDLWSLGATLFKLYTKALLCPLLDKERKNSQYLIARHEEVIGPYPDELHTMLYTYRIPCTQSVDHYKKRLHQYSMQTQDPKKEALFMSFSDLLTRLLAFLPHDRLTANQVLDHPFCAEKVTSTLTNSQASDLEHSLPQELYPTKEELITLSSSSSKTFSDFFVFGHTLQQEPFLRTVGSTGNTYLQHDAYMRYFLKESPYILQSVPLFYVHKPHPEIDRSVTVCLYEQGFYPLSNHPFSSLCMHTVLYHIAKAIADFHNRGVLHNRISATSVFIDAFGHVKLGELIQASFIEQTSALMRMMHEKPLFAYGSPELLNNESISYASDLYSFGKLLEIYHPKADSIRSLYTKMQARSPLARPLIEEVLTTLKELVL